MTSYKSVLVIAVCLLAGMLLGACKKASGPEVARVRLDPEGLKFVHLPLNKFFIYKDSATGNLDSVVVTKSTLEEVYVPGYSNGVPFDFGNHPPSRYEKLSITLSRVVGTAFSDWFIGVTTSTGIYYGSNNHSPVQLTSVLDSLSAFSYTTAATVPSSVIVEGKTYADVIIARGSNLRTSIVYYWAKNIGLIKVMVLKGPSTKTSTLVRFG